MKDEPLLYELSKPGKQGVAMPAVEKPSLPKSLEREGDLCLPEVSEPEVVRHFTRLSQLNFSVDTHFYPLGSCTMKYNPKVNETISRLSGFAQVHPYALDQDSQGIRELMYELESFLSELTGMHQFTLQPAAGAHGELTGMMIVKAYFSARGEKNRTKVIVPDSSHGTNPASAAIFGFDIVEIPSNEKGRVDLECLQKSMGEDTACLMLTNPNTLGLFETDIIEIARIVHESGGLLYYDGANLNAMMGLCRPGDMGFDIVHLNLHKTFSTPHGGGGPGAGPVGVSENLARFLPVPRIEKKDSLFVFNYDEPESIGKVKTFYGNIGVAIKAYVYIRIMGLAGLKQATLDAILNANYLKVHIEKIFDVPYKDTCMHEFVASTKNMHENDITAVDVGKRFLDYGFHAPTVAFPLIVHNALMIEPTETESKETLDAFIAACSAIAEEAKTNPELLKTAPHTLSRRRCDEVHAARFPNLCYPSSL